MKKSQELTDQNSCLNKAMDDELLFVLLERDPAAAATIRFWAAERVRLGKNVRTDTKIKRALGQAAEMDPNGREDCGNVAEHKAGELKMTAFNLLDENWQGVFAPENFQDDLDHTIGRLDRVLSKLVMWGRWSKERNEKHSERTSPITQENLCMDEPNQQTLKHHAEDMIAAGEKILRDLGKKVEGTSQPG